MHRWHVQFASWCRRVHFLLPHLPQLRRFIVSSFWTAGMHTYNIGVSLPFVKRVNFPNRHRCQSSLNLEARIAPQSTH